MTIATPSLDIQFPIYCSSLRDWYPTLRYAQSTFRHVKHSGVVWHESINKNTHQTITTKWNETKETVHSTSGTISLVNFPWTVYRRRSQRIISNAICRTIVSITGSGSMKTRPLFSKGLIPAWRASRYPYYHPADSKWANRNCIGKMYTCPASVCPAGATICIRVVTRVSTLYHMYGVSVRVRSTHVCVHARPSLLVYKYSCARYGCWTQNQ